MTPHAILLMGPTASGKTGLALDLATRLRQRGQAVEIISVDSASVYRGLDIGTAKLGPAERRGIPHHLIDVCEPVEAYSAARFRDDAMGLIEAIHARGALPLLVGGTMLYFRGLTCGLDALPAADPGLRAELSAQAAAEGWPALHARLARHDPVAAQRLHPNDRQRIQRALEVVLSSGRPLSEQQSGARPTPALPLLRLALAPATRAELHARIAQRLDTMWGAGFVEEVAGLYRRGDLHVELPAVRAVGYRQLWDYLEGHCALGAAQQRALEATRQFAKRQMTWLRSEHDLCWLNSDDAAVVDLALRHIEPWLSGVAC